MNTVEPLLSVRDLTVELATEHGWTSVLDGVSFDIGRGETVGLVGESGSGKSITSLAIMGLLPKRSSKVTGSIRFDGRELLDLDRTALEDLRGAEVAMVFQEPMTSLNPAFTVGSQITETLRRHTDLGRKAATARAVELLDRVGIPNAARRIHQYPHELSGGMRQRVMIAMAVACEPKLLIADEPTTALDVTIQAQILDLLAQMRDELGLSMMFVSHDLGVVGEICGQVVVLYAGQVMERTGCDRLFEMPRHPYSRGLVAASTPVDPGSTLFSIPGAPPAAWARPPGCRFAPRCPYALEACTEGHVELRETGRDAHRCLRAEDLPAMGASERSSW